jgi:hypothetical protein
MGIENIDDLKPGQDPKLADPPDAEPQPEPAEEKFDPHNTPLDDIDDAQWLAEDDPRRQAVEEFKERELHKEG